MIHYELCLRLIDELSHLWFNEDPNRVYIERVANEREQYPIRRLFILNILLMEWMQWMELQQYFDIEFDGIGLDWVSDYEAKSEGSLQWNRIRTDLQLGLWLQIDWSVKSNLLILIDLT